MRRRGFLQAMALMVGGSAAARDPWGVDVAPWYRRWREERTFDPKMLARLRDAVGGHGRVLVAGDAGWDEALVTFNRRTMETPQARVMVREPEAVAGAVAWAKEYGVSFAVRGGGHSYEGFSQSRGLVVDMRELHGITIDGTRVRIGAGATLGQVYAAVGKQGLAFAAGSCADVGVAGQSFGGGFGFLGRRFGLSADNLTGVDLVGANGPMKVNDDLLWALKGAGNGSFGIATHLTFTAHELKKVVHFQVRWLVPIDDAVKVMQAWQSWAPEAPDAITCMLSLGGRKGEQVALLMHGQSTDSETALQRELGRVIANIGLTPETALKTSTASWLASTGASEDDGNGISTTMKGKSDYVKKPMSAEGMRTLFRGLCAHLGMIRVHCDGYGGAVKKVAADATAFVHRDALYSMQYGATWKNAKDTPRYVAAMREVYDAMRPYVSGSSYVNYPDLDLDDWGHRYWGANFERLRRIKRAVDPTNLFRHAQSIPG